jgi:hypothetical protein
MGRWLLPPVVAASMLALIRDSIADFRAPAAASIWPDQGVDKHTYC